MKIIRFVRLSLSTCLSSKGHQYIRSTSCLSIHSARPSSSFSHSIHSTHSIRPSSSFHSSSFRPSSSTFSSFCSLSSSSVRPSFYSSLYHHPTSHHSHQSFQVARMSTDTSSNMFSEQEQSASMSSEKSLGLDESPSSEQSTSTSSEQFISHRNDFLGLDLESALASKGQSQCCLVMINSGTMDIHLVKRLWRYCDYRICADGGANRLFDGMKNDDDRVVNDSEKSSNEVSSVLEEYIPDAIKGDLDSLRPDVKKYYSCKGCDVIYDSDQDHNDLDKCMVAIRDKYKTENKPITVIVLGAFGGRLDQEVCNIHALFKWHDTFHRIVLLGGENVAFLLGPGSHEISPIKGVEGPGVSLLPMGGRVRDIVTEGLQWDLSHHSMEMGGLISSSNRIKDSCTFVTVRTSDAVIWHCTLAPK